MQDFPTHSHSANEHVAFPDTTEAWHNADKHFLFSKPASLLIANNS